MPNTKPTATPSNALLRSWPSPASGATRDYQSLLQGMRSITRPNGEPQRSILQILDDAIALESSFQHEASSRSNSEESTDLEENQDERKQ